MTDDLLRQLHGNLVSHFSLVKYLSIGVERVIIHLASECAFDVYAMEIRLGKDEAYTIEIDKSQGKQGIERIEAGWPIGSIRVVKRQDWIEPSTNSAGLIGNNPRIHSWGNIGTAPSTAEHCCIVNFGVVLTSGHRDRQAMVYLADYPGMVCFTTNALEIASLCDSYRGAQSPIENHHLLRPYR